MLLYVCYITVIYLLYVSYVLLYSEKAEIMLIWLELTWYICRQRCRELTAGFDFRCAEAAADPDVDAAALSFYTLTDFNVSGA